MKVSDGFCYLRNCSLNSDVGECFGDAYYWIFDLSGQLTGVNIMNNKLLHGLAVQSIAVATTPGNPYFLLADVPSVARVLNDLPVDAVYPILLLYSPETPVPSLSCPDLLLGSLLCPLACCFTESLLRVCLNIHTK